MKINEIFYSLQGEGFHAGTPAVFVRFAGCNLTCSFCDTKHNTFLLMGEKDIVEKVCEYPARHVVLTGGEPSLQITPSFIEALHKAGKYVAVETNGTRKLPAGIDWVTCSPKYQKVVLPACDEIKVVYEGQDMTQYDKMLFANHKFVQPCDVKDAEKNAANIAACVEFVKQNPEWRLSLQTQKILNIQ